jgi:Transglycosylase-like domain
VLGPVAVIALVAGLAVAAVTTAPFASAQVASQATSDSSATALRAQADALANRYFDALTKFQTLDAQITRDEQVVRELSAAARKARADAKARAIVAYRMSGVQLSALIDGANSIDAARRAHLIDHVNARDEATFTKLHNATQDLRVQHDALEATRRAEATALAELRDQGAEIDSKLARAEQAEQATAAAAAAAQVAVATTTVPRNSIAAAAPTTTTVAPVAAAPPPPPSYSGTGGTSPHHNDPFLTCVRGRESSGSYGAVNSSGPYLGAYQFLQATWNVTASHSGRADLVGVPANSATPYDQDEMAWTLYQWEGMGPWGGSCP